MTWVRNGNPLIDTFGFFGKPCCWISDATLASAKARAPKSRATSRAARATTTMMTVRSKRRERGRTSSHTP